MKRFHCRPTTTRHILATILIVAFNTASSHAQTDALVQPESRPCPSADQDGVRIPDSIQAPDHLRRKMEEMLQKSATFRAQCRRIAEAPRLYVRVRIDSRIANRSYRARTTICRSPSGITAAIDINAFGDPMTWIAHEFEHLIEQLEGVDLRDLAHRRQGVWHSGDEMFETERAIRAGVQVMHEMREGPGRPAALAEHTARVAVEPPALRLVR